MEQLGETLTELGLKLIPISLAAYFPLRLLEHIWKHGPSHLVKSIWYLALGVTYLTDKVGIDTLVTYICFIEFWDLLLKQLELNKERKAKKAL